MNILRPTLLAHGGVGASEKLNDGCQKAVESAQWNKIMSLWNFGDPQPACDTVGAVALDYLGNLAAALSTGGSGLMMKERVGDVAIFGAGLDVTENCAVAMTGRGEEIIKRRSAARITRMIESGVRAQDACEEEVNALTRITHHEYGFGAIAVSWLDFGCFANRSMAHWAWQSAA